jgi:hypothetical protein
VHYTEGEHSLHPESACKNDKHKYCHFPGMYEDQKPSDVKGI